MADRVTRRAFLAAGAAAALTTAACTPFSSSNRTPSQAGGSSSGATQTSTPPSTQVRLIGDGSTSDTGPQPRQPVPEPLLPGQTPPQFVVFSWDGAANLSTGLFPRFRQLARDHGAAMTFFLSGIYALPEDKRDLYNPPQHPVGASDINFLNTDEVLATMSEVGAAWLDGNEIGTHFNGHFCGDNGVALWSSEDWVSEISQAVGFVKTWRTNTGHLDDPSLPFDYDVELIGGRTPCLQGQEGLLPAATSLGWKYDASSPGGAQVWPSQRSGLWDFPLQQIPFPNPRAGRGPSALSMDYNLMYKQTDGDTTADPSQYDSWRNQATEAYLAGFQRAYTTNRAPYFIGNHFEEWNGGIYMDAVEDTLTSIAAQPDVRLVSFKQLVAWLDVQSTATLDKLRSLPVGIGPENGWATFLAQP